MGASFPTGFADLAVKAPIRGGDAAHAVVGSPTRSGCRATPLPASWPRRAIDFGRPCGQGAMVADGYPEDWRETLKLYRYPLGASWRRDRISSSDFVGHRAPES